VDLLLEQAWEQAVRRAEARGEIAVEQGSLELYELDVRAPDNPVLVPETTDEPGEDDGDGDGDGRDGGDADAGAPDEVADQPA
jgi:hypothetical protein